MFEYTCDYSIMKILMVEFCGVGDEINVLSLKQVIIFGKFDIVVLIRLKQLVYICIFSGYRTNMCRVCICIYSN